MLDVDPPRHYWHPKIQNPGK